MTNDNNKLKNAIHQLVYKYGFHKSTDYMEQFNMTAEELSNTLTFNTREEYLLWVKQWKEDYAKVVEHHRYNKVTMKWHRVLRPDKDQRYADMLDKMDTPVARGTDESFKKRYGELKTQLSSLIWLPGTEYNTSYAVVIHLLLLREASKLRAGRQMKEKTTTL